MIEVNFVAAAAFLIAVYCTVKAAVKSGIREMMGIQDDDDDDEPEFPEENLKNALIPSASLQTKT